MNYDEYSSYFEDIVNTGSENQNPPYDQSLYYDYTKLNWSRMSRWFKTMTLSGELSDAIKKIQKPQNWLLITEPWCGDAAHNLPIIVKAAAQNPLISLSIELRDSEPHSISNYLTNGTKSIPKLVIRDGNDDDLQTWGPRPQACQELYASLTEQKAPFDELTMKIHTWYNANKGVDTQEELTRLIVKSLSK